MPHIANAPGLEISAVCRAQSQLSSAACHRDGPLVAGELHAGPRMRTRGKDNGFGDLLSCD
jgi:hypothetical protein